MLGGVYLVTHVAYVHAIQRLPSSNGICDVIFEVCMHVHLEAPMCTQTYTTCVSRINYKRSRRDYSEIGAHLDPGPYPEDQVDPMV